MTQTKVLVVDRPQTVSWSGKAGMIARLIGFRVRVPAGRIVITLHPSAKSNTGSGGLLSNMRLGSRISWRYEGKLSHGTPMEMALFDGEEHWTGWPVSSGEADPYKEAFDRAEQDPIGLMTSLFMSK